MKPQNEVAVLDYHLYKNKQWILAIQINHIGKQDELKQMTLVTLE